MKCPRCGKESDGAFCPDCGAQMDWKENTSSGQYQSSKTPSGDKKTKKKRGCLTYVLVAVLALIIVVGLLNSCSDDGGNSNTQTDGQSNSSPEDDGFIYVGESFESGDLKITVNEADANFTDYEDEYGWNAPEDGMKYVMVGFTYENTGDSGTQYVSIYDYECYADNATCEQEYGLDNSNFMNTNLEPGRNVTFRIYFAVPVYCQSIELSYQGTWSFTDATIKIQ